MPRESSKCRQWEQERRNRLKEAFNALAKVLPCYDPSVTICQINILQQATVTILELQEEIKKILSPASENDTTRDNLIKKLQHRINKLLIRNEQLNNLLRDAGISVPKYVGIVKKFKRPYPWKNRVSTEQTKTLSNCELEKENISNKQSPSKKRKTKLITCVAPKHRSVDVRKSEKIVKRTKSGKKSSVTNCLLLLSQPITVKTTIHQPCYLITNQSTTSAAKVETSKTNLQQPKPVLSSFPCVNPTIPSLGPGTLILKNGTVIPVMSQPVIFPTPTIVANPFPTVKIQNIAEPKEVPKVQKSILTGLTKLPLCKPKYCLTTTTQINKVPIPALTSKYANNGLLLKTKVSEPARSTNKIQRTKVNKQKTATAKVTTTANKPTVETETGNVKKNKDESSSVENSSSTTSSTNDKGTDVLENIQKSNSPLIEENGDSASNSTNNITEVIHNEKPNLNTNIPSNIDKKTVLQKNPSKELIDPIDKPPGNDLPVLPQCDDYTASTIVTTTAASTTQEALKALDLNLPHSELSNDIFASLQDGPSCQNPESTSPTAAFLMAFPLVSSQSQRGTPNLMQIGTMDTTKTTQSEGNLMNLDHFPFFSSKDSCGHYYHSYANLVSKCSEVLNNSIDSTNLDYVNTKGSTLSACEKLPSKSDTAQNSSKKIENTKQNDVYQGMNVVDQNAKNYSDISYSGLREKTGVKIESENIHFDIFHDKSDSSIFKDKENDGHYNIFAVKPSEAATTVSKDNELTDNVPYIDNHSHCSNNALNELPFTFPKDCVDNMQNGNENSLETTSRNDHSNISKGNKIREIDSTSTTDANLQNECRPDTVIVTELTCHETNITTDTASKNKETNIYCKSTENANNLSNNLKQNIVPISTNVINKITNTIPNTSSDSINTKPENRTTGTFNIQNANISSHMQTKNMDKLIVNDVNVVNNSNVHSAVHLRHETEQVNANLDIRISDPSSGNVSFENNKTSIPMSTDTLTTSRSRVNYVKISNDESKVDGRDCTFKKADQYNMDMSSSKDKMQHHDLQNPNMSENDHFNMFQQPPSKPAAATNNIKLDHIPYNIFEMNSEHSSNILNVQNQNHNVSVTRHESYNVFEHNSTCRNVVPNKKSKSENTCLNMKLSEHMSYNLFEKYPIQELEPSFQNQNHRNINYNTFQQNTPKSIQNVPDKFVNAKDSLEVNDSYNYNNIFNNKSISSNQTQLNRRSEQFMESINYNIFPEITPKGIIPIQDMHQQNDNVKISDVFHNKSTTNPSKIDGTNNMDMINNIHYNETVPKSAGNHNNCNNGENNMNHNFNYTLYPAKIKDNTQQRLSNCENRSDISVQYNMSNKHDSLSTHTYQDKKTSKKIDTYGTPAKIPSNSDNAPFVFPEKNSNPSDNVKDSKICKIHEQNLTHFNLFHQRNNLSKEMSTNPPCEKLDDKNTYNIFQDKLKEENIIKLSEIIPQPNKSLDHGQRVLEQRSQCYFATTYPNTSNNFNYKGDAAKMCPTCSYMNLNKNYSNPLYTSSSNYNYNYHADPNINQNYYKSNITKNDGKSYYPFNYENYSDYKKTDSTYTSNKVYGNGNHFSKDKKNTAKTKNVAQNKPVNWMTTPESKPSIAECLIPPFSAQSYPFTTSETAELSNIMELKKPMELQLLPDDKQFSWSPTKMPNFLDPTQNIVTPTLPTLVGDLALSNHLPLAEQKCPAKEGKRKHCTSENQNNFLSVSQLVEHGKTESAPARTTTRRNSGSRVRNSAHAKNRRSSKCDATAEEKANQIKPSNNFNTSNNNDLFYEQKTNKNTNKNTSNYSAEALIGNQVTPRKVNDSSNKTQSSSSFLTENIITYFPTVEENYMSQTHNFQTGSFPHNTFQNNTFSTNSFIYTAPTITSTYLSNNFDNNTHEYLSENVNSLQNVKDTKLGGNKSCKQTGKDDKNASYTKKIKKKPPNDITSGLANLEFPFLSMSGTTNSPILTDDFHPHTSFLAPPNSYPSKNSLYAKQSNEFNANSLLPLPALPRNTVQHSEVSPSINVGGTSLTNFNLSTIFPEMNKGTPTNVYSDNRNKENPQSSSLQVPFNMDLKYSFSS